MRLRARPLTLNGSFILQINNIYEQCICCVSQLFHRWFNPGTLRIARSAVRTLRSVRKQTKSPVFEFLSGMGVFDHSPYRLPV